MPDGIAISCPKRTISRYGVKLSEESRLPTGLPFRVATSLSVAYEEGFPVMSRYGQVNYPTRNFALALPKRTCLRRTTLPLDVVPACRHAEGTISSSGVPDVWRMASEDSDELVSGLAVIHRLRNLCDLD